MNPKTTDHSPGYEVSDVSVRVIVRVAIGIVLGLLVVFAAAALIYRDGSRPAVRRNSELSFRHGALEESSIARDWKAQDAAVTEHLNTYGWVDRNAGVVRIPIDRTVETMLRKSAEKPGASP